MIHAKIRAERQDQSGQRDSPQPSRGGGAVPLGEFERFVNGRLHTCQIAHRSRVGELRFVDRRAGPLFEFHHQLDTVERTQGEVVEQGVGVDFTAEREPPDDIGDRILARGPAALPACNVDPLQLVRSGCTWKRSLRPQRETANALVGLQLLVRFADDCFAVCIRLEHKDRVYLLARALLRRHHGRLAHARDRIQYALHILRKNVQALRRNDHLFRAAENAQPAFRIEFADVARVQPAFLIPQTAFPEVTGRDVFAAQQNFAVGRDFNFNARDRLSRPFLYANRTDD